MDVNRKRTFCITGQWFGSNSRVNRLYKRKEISNINFLASRQIKREKASLPVHMRGSKTSLLDLPVQSMRERFGRAKWSTFQTFAKVDSGRGGRVTLFSQDSFSPYIRGLRFQRMSITGVAGQ